MALSRPFEEMQSSENQKVEGSFSRGNRFSGSEATSEPL